LQIENLPLSNHNEEDPPLNTRTSTEALYQPTLSVSHHRSNTVPSRYRKTDSRKASNQQTTHLSPTYKRNDNNQQELSSRPFSPSSLQTQPKRRIRVIDDTDEGESPSTSTVNPDE